MIFIRELLSLFCLFFKISLLTFGGGYTCLPIMEKELVEKKKIISNDELLSNYAIAQMMPGLITVNLGVLIGYKKNKLPGALAITFGTVFPPLIIGIIIAAALNRYLGSNIVSDIFWGIRTGVCVLVFTVIYKLIKQTERNLKNISIILISFFLYYLLNLSPIFIMILVILLAVMIARKSN